MHKSTKSKQRKAQGIRAIPCGIEIIPGVYIPNLDIHKYSVDDDLLGLTPLNADNDAAVNEAVLAFLRRLRNLVGQCKD